MNEVPDNQVWLNNKEHEETQRFINRHESSRAISRSLQAAEQSTDVDVLSSEGGAIGSKIPTKPLPLNTIPAQVMSMFSTTMSNNVQFAEIVNVLENMQNLDFDANMIRNSALGIYYETSKRVQFRLGLFLNPAKETILDCRRLKGDSFVMGNFFTILTNELSKKPELGVKVVLEDDDDMNYFDEDEDDLNTLEELFGSGHLRLKNDPNLVKRLMREIESSDMETQVNDTGLLAHAAELPANVETLATEGGKPLVNLLEGKLQVNNAALVRQSAVLLKELTRMHPEIFSEQTAKSMVQAMGRWVPKAKATSEKEQHELTSSTTTVTNLAQGISSLMNSHSDLIKAVRLDDDEVNCIINTLQKYPSPHHDQVVDWMSKMQVC